jgi:hypothetical protein
VSLTGSKKKRRVPKKAEDSLFGDHKVYVDLYEINEIAVGMAIA